MRFDPGYVPRLLLLFLIALVAVVPLSHAIAGDMREIVDDAGRKVAVPVHIAKVFVAGPPAATLLYTLAPEDLLGWSQAPKDAAKPYLAAPYRNLPVYGRLTGHGAAVGLAQVKALKPDLILDVGEIDKRYADLADHVQQQTDIPYILLDGHLAKTGDTYRRLGQILGKDSRADILARYADNLLRDLPAKIHRLPDHPPLRLYYGRGAEGLQSAGKGAINLEMLDLLGVENVAAEQGGGKLTNFTAAQIIGWNPAVIVAQDRAFADTIRRDPTWQKVEAVQRGRIYAQPLPPFGWVDDPPGVNRLLGLQWLAIDLYPSLPHADLAATVRQFYDLFYHLKLSDPQMRNLLKDAAKAGQ